MSADDAIQSLRQKAEAVMQRHIAYHEAGHALLAVLLGRDLNLVSITKGQTVIDGKPLEDLFASEVELTADQTAYLIEDVKITMAGYVGELVGIGKANPNLGSDLKRMNTMLRRIPDRKGEGLGLQNEVTELMSTHKESLVRLAEALLVEKEITGTRAREILQLPVDTSPPQAQ